MTSDYKCVLVGVTVNAPVVRVMPGFHHSVAVAPLPFPPAVVQIGSNPIFAVLFRVHCSNAVNGKTFPAIPFSRATATAATERKNGNGMVETRHNSYLHVLVVSL